MAIILKIGRIFSLLGGLLALVAVIFEVFSLPFAIPGLTASFDLLSIPSFNYIVQIMASIGLIAMASKKLNFEPIWSTGLLTMVFGLLASSILGILAGIIIMGDTFVEDSEMEDY